jgi:hypothetical protein
LDFVLNGLDEVKCAIAAATELGVRLLDNAQESRPFSLLCLVKRLLTNVPSFGARFLSNHPLRAESSGQPLKGIQ